MFVMRLAVFAISNVLMFNMLSRHYNDVCAASWWSLFTMKQSTYCTIVKRALDTFQFAPLIAAFGIPDRPDRPDVV